MSDSPASTPSNDNAPASPYPTPAYGSPYPQEPAPPAYSAPPSYPPSAPPAYPSSAPAQPGYAPYAQAPAPAPGYAYPYAAAPKTNTLAIVSLVSAIAGFVIIPFIASIVAVITGHMSLKQLKTNGEGGRGLALTGTIVGWVGVGLSVIGIVLLILWFVVIFGVIGASTYSYS